MNKITIHSVMEDPGFMCTPATVRHNAKTAILKKIYKPTKKIIDEQYATIVKDWLKVNGKNPNDYRMHHLCLDSNLFWFNGNITGYLPYGIRPNYVNTDELKRILRTINREQKSINDEIGWVNSYIVKVLIEARTLVDIRRYFPKAVRDCFDFREIFDEVGRLTPNPELEALRDKYLAIINERLVINLLVKS